jgi:16S rRNA (guanine966-N2)-methyltransferase
MKVTTGTARGFKLESVPGMDVRPTADKVKQAIFNMLQFELEGRRIIDLFAGTGQLGIEALSRGATYADLVDNLPASVAIIRKNLKKTKLSEKATVHLSDYKSFLKGYSKQKCHILLLDPPYRAGYIARILKFVQTFDIMAPNGIIICESDTADVIPSEIGCLVQEKRKVHGSTAITMLRRVVDKQGEDRTHA